MEIVLIALLTITAAAVGTLTGFGTSTIMVPVLLLWLPLPQTLLLVGVVHWFGNIWKITLFRQGFDWRLVLWFGIPGIILTWFGAQFIFSVSDQALSRTLGVFIIAYTIFLFIKPSFKFKQNAITAVIGGALSGFFAGIFGIGGAIRSAFLTAFNLPKAIYIATAGAIGLVIDSARLLTYWTGGSRLLELPYWSLIIFIPASLVGAQLAKKVVDRIAQRNFRFVVVAFLFGVGVKLLFWP
ncbi:MAG: sulfite exporter TauE/SafE family protein [Candidatus Buchananbacteria bacterium CG10_big_fil_rev_8_21_14_0_10_42_9]|uniref:Probable membrane transporter protein n=1 Tax=Candidatus Buchananbacteria bacterium CG10_big_fil_rev_8_21_14_0_10_42_9 TaxID=1974526 RepID=A0A2H0W178_9BACT|nr:MAG: sulfite exporter TauE/SafE family protein [Candidatus Buchananbacteria bacterium CG10_big_fil_rev_8_21_14_0_10_42_9]